MKRFLLTGLLFLGLGQLSSYAQSGGSYTDDIYYSSEDAKKDAEAQQKKDAEAQARREQARQNEEYSSSDRNYESDGDYIDYDDDDYFISSCNAYTSLQQTPSHVHLAAFPRTKWERGLIKGTQGNRDI